MSVRHLPATLRFIVTHPLNRDHRVRALWRFTRWQVSSRLARGPRAVTFVNDTRLLVSPGMVGATGNIYCGLQEFEDMAFVLHSLRPGDLFVDVGANVGSYTVLASGGVGADTIACEPVPATFRLLQRNIGLNQLEERVEALQVAVGAQSGTVEMTETEDSTNHLTAEGESGIRVPVDTLETILGGRVPRIMKVDVEGMETAVVDGMQELLNRPDPLAIILELNGSGASYGFDENALHERVLSNGFMSMEYRPLERVLKDLQGQKSRRGNTLYIKQLGWFEERVRNAPTFSLVNGEI